MLDELLIGGEISETSKKNVLKAIAAQDMLQEVGCVEYNRAGIGPIPAFLMVSESVKCYTSTNSIVIKYNGIGNVFYCTKNAGILATVECYHGLVSVLVSTFNSSI